VEVVVNILLIAKAYTPETGGIETYSEEVAKAYADLGHQVTVLTAHPGEIGCEQRGSVFVHNVGQGNQLKTFLRMMEWLRYHRDSDYNFVHATSWRVGIPALLLRPKTPLAVTIHGREVFMVPKALKPVMALVLRRAKLLPTVSQPILNLVRDKTGLPLEQAFSNWNGISFEEEARRLDSKPNGFNIFCMCRMVERKNVATAIVAVSDLIHQGVDLQFDIAGSGPELNSLRKLLSKQATGDRIKLHGRIPDELVPEFYRNAHVFLHPQIATEGGADLEGFGLTIADGMAFGCIPIAGASGGPLDFIRDNETGLLVDGHDIEALKSCLTKLLQSGARRTELSKAAHSFAHSQLTWHRHILNIIRKI